MKCLSHKHHDETGEYLGREYYDTPSSIRGCNCESCTRGRAIHSAAAILGRKGGSAKSAEKTAAVRENGKKGGRPRKREVGQKKLKKL